MFDFDFEGLDLDTCADFQVIGLDGTQYPISRQTSTVRDVMAFLEAKYGIPSDEQRLCHEGRELSDPSAVLPEDLLELHLLRSKADEEEWLSRVAENPFALSDAPASIKCNKAVVRAAAVRETSALAYAADTLRQDRHFALDLVSADGGALRYFAEEVRAERDVVLMAVRAAGSVLRCAAASLRADSEVVLAAVCQDAKALIHADPQLLVDDDFARQAMDCNRLVGDYLASLTTDKEDREQQSRQEEDVNRQDEIDVQNAGIVAEVAFAHFQQSSAIFLDARSADEFDKSHIAGSMLFSERSPVLQRLAEQREDLELSTNPAVKQMVSFPSKPVILYSDSGSDDLAVGYISRCVRGTRFLRRACRAQPSLGNENRVFRLIGGLNQWKRMGLPVNGEHRPLINGNVLLEAGIHGYLDLDDDI
ncbi:unnamed protein product [Effrenium voratum]|uniref:Rhodanese domain-containing protein n=1 Tax=Effrenium voratum TaxID=2562239 RepID=A0AA36MPU7_9DINO|nr:unnamed protein product [Effrenium voratum]CAJ1424308.1 unnamed protein product [Effrenium voratum]